MRQLLSILFLSCGTLFAAENLEQRLEPPAPTTEQLLPVASAKEWANVPGHPEVDWHADARGLYLNWNGKSNYSGARPLFGQVSHTLPLPLKRGADNRVRLTIDVLIDELAPDAEMMPVIQLLDADKNMITQWDIYPPDYQMYVNSVTAPDRPRRLDRTFAVPEQAAGLRVIFECRGNALKARIVRAGLSPAHPKPKWNVEKRWVNAKRPDIPYGINDANPEPDVPKLSDEEITRLLEQRPLAVPKLEKINDRIKFTINGREEPFTIAWGPFNLSGCYLQNMEAMGFRIFSFPVCLGPRADTSGWPFNIWIDEDKYDFDRLAKGIRELLRRVPNAYIMLYLRVTLPTAWAKANPDAIHTDAKGNRAVSEWSRVNRYGGKEPQGEREFYEACNTSKVFREGASKALYEIGRWLSSAPEGKAVIGAYIHGGADTQWFFSMESEYADYSPGSLKAFRNYLRLKYHSDSKALSAAWGFPVTFETVQFPSYASRRRQFGPDPNLPRSPLMEYNGRNAQAADYNEFLSVANTRRQIAFSRAFKKGSGGRLLAGTYWPTLPASYPLQHTGFIEMLNSPDIDFISRGGLPGAIFHGKITVAEFDLRNVRSGLDAWLDYDHPFHAKSQAEFRRQVLLGFGSQLAVGGGYHLWDMGGGWFFHPSTRKILTEGQALTKAVKNYPALGENYIGVFIDEDAANQLNTLGWSFNSVAVESLFLKFGWNWASAWEFVGIPVRFFLQQDALNPNLELPRVAIFLNPLTITLEQGAAIRDRFERGGRVVVYMTSPGLAAPGTPENPSKITGFKIKPDMPGTSNKVLQICADDPLFAGLQPKSQLGLYNIWSGMEWSTSPVAAPDSPGQVIARYHGTELAGMLVDRNKERTKVWIGAPGALNIPMLRNMAKEAGLKPMIKGRSGLFYGAGLLGVVGTPRGGEERIELPEGVRVEKCLTGQKYRIENGCICVNLATAETFGDVAIFSVTGEK